MTSRTEGVPVQRRLYAVLTVKPGEHPVWPEKRMQLDVHA